MKTMVKFNTADRGKLAKDILDFLETNRTKDLSTVIVIIADSIIYRFTYDYPKGYLILKLVGRKKIHEKLNSNIDSMLELINKLPKETDIKCIGGNDLKKITHYVLVN